MYQYTYIHYIYCYQNLLQAGQPVLSIDKHFANLTLELGRFTMGNIPLSADDIAFLKEKGNKKNSTQDIKNAFKEFTQDLDVGNKKMDEVRIDFKQFCDKADTVFNTDSETLTPPRDKNKVYEHLFRAFDSDQVGNIRLGKYYRNCIKNHYHHKYT